MDIAVRRAVIDGDLEEFQRLVNDNGEGLLTTKDADNTAPLHVAAEHGHVDIVRFLHDKLGQYYFIKTVDEDLRTVVHWAVWKNHIEIVEFLRSTFMAGSKVFTAQTRAGFTALHYVGTTGNTDMLQVLLKAGCQPDVRDKIGQLPEDVARRFGHGELAELLEQARLSSEIVEERPSPRLDAPNLSPPSSSGSRSGAPKDALRSQTFLYVLVGITIGVALTQFLAQRSATKA